MSKYLHEFTSEEIDEILKVHAHTKIGRFMELYKQPDWCMYPNALEGNMGCWSLIGGMIHKIEDCEDCDEVKHG